MTEETHYDLFVEEFEKLTPFEVDHFCGLLFKTGKSGTVRQEELSEILRTNRTT